MTGGQSATSLPGLVAWRVAHEASQQDVADLLSVPRSVVGMWEQGRSHPTMRTFIDLCKILQVDPNTMLGWKS